MIELFPTPNTFNGIEIFPEEIERNPYVFYHGTSEIYSHEIESYGLFPNHKPLTNYFYEIFNIASHLVAFTDGKDDFAAFNDSFRSVSGYFRDFTRISLSAVSICAVAYSIGNTSGGQGLRNLIELKKAIIDLDYSKLGGIFCEISDKQKFHFENIENELGKINSLNGVVYAIKFDESDIQSIDYCDHFMHGVLLSTKHIEPTSLIAKMIIPQSVIIPKDILEQGNHRTLELLNNVRATPFIRNILDYNRDRNPIIEVVESIIG